MEVEDLRLAIYGALARHGRVPDPATLAADLECSVAEVLAGQEDLAGQRHLVLGERGEVVMAHPFAVIPLGFSVMGRAALWWGGCAWDAFALPHLLPAESPVLVATRCPGCAAAMAWDVGIEGPPAGSQVAHFLVPAARIWDDVVHACANQRIFCGPDCVAAWLETSGNPHGYVMDLPTLWRLARGWYAGRLDRGYRRRDPGEASEYFRSVGLHGDFWGLAQA